MLKSCSPESCLLLLRVLLKWEPSPILISIEINGLDIAYSQARHTGTRGSLLYPGVFLSQQANVRLVFSFLLPDLSSSRHPAFFCESPGHSFAMAGVSVSSSFSPLQTVCLALCQAQISLSYFLLTFLICIDPSTLFSLSLTCHPV